MLNQLTLGDQVRLVLEVEGETNSVQVNIPTRLAQELMLKLNETVDIVMRADDIHIFTEY